MGRLASHRHMSVFCAGEMTESRAKRVRIKEMDGWTLGTLIDYVYTAEIQVTEENVQVRAAPEVGRVQFSIHAQRPIIFIVTRESVVWWNKIATH